MTDGVIVWKAAYRNANDECSAVGNELSRCMSVEYEAMMMGGSGGISGCDTPWSSVLAEPSEGM